MFRMTGSDDFVSLNTASLQHLNDLFCCPPPPSQPTLLRIVERLIRGVDLEPLIKPLSGRIYDYT